MTIERPVHHRYSADQRALNVDLTEIQQRWQSFVDNAREPLPEAFEALVHDLEYLIWDAQWTRQEIAEARA